MTLRSVLLDDATGLLSASTSASGGATTPTVMQANLTIASFTQMLFRVPIVTSAGQLIILGTAAQLVGV